MHPSFTWTIVSQKQRVNCGRHIKFASCDTVSTLTACHIRQLSANHLLQVERAPLTSSGAHLSQRIARRFVPLYWRTTNHARWGIRGRALLRIWSEGEHQCKLFAVELWHFSNIFSRYLLFVQMAFICWLIKVLLTYLLNYLINYFLTCELSRVLVCSVCPSWVFCYLSVRRFTDMDPCGL